jgi:hypothetical protein
MLAGSRFPFSSQFSLDNHTDAWVATEENGWSSDTLSFVVGPFAYTYSMRCVDEHQRRENTPDTLSFYGNYPPCVQCVELTNNEVASEYALENDCWDQECASRVDSLYAAWAFPPPSGPEYATAVDFSGQVYYKLDTGDVWLTRPLQIAGVDSVTAPHFGYKLWLHGKDHPLEPPVDPEDRIMSWRYQVDYENDPNNIIKDGGGIDNLRSPTYFFSTNPDDPVYVDDNGVWVLQIRFGVPFALLSAASLAEGIDAYREELFLKYDDWDAVDRAFELTTLQLGRAWASVIARDVTDCDARLEKGKYHYYTRVRVPPNHGLACNDAYDGEEAQLILNDFGAESAEVDDPFVKYYFLGILYPNGDVYPPPTGGKRHFAGR